MECASFIDHRLRDLQNEHGDEQLPKAIYQAEMDEASEILIAWARYDEEHGVNDIRAKFSVVGGLDTE